jgi:transcriptional regulator with XRE-family HTH domain
MNFGRAIRLCRAAFNLSQAELAERAGVTASYLSLLESGQRQPSVGTIKKLCKALGVPVDLLMLLAAGREEGTDMQRLSEALLKLLVTAETKKVSKRK